MKLKCAVLCLFAFAIFAISFNANAEDKKDADKKLTNSERAKEILEKADISYITTTTQITEKKGITYITVTKKLKKYYPDGTFADTRETTIVKVKKFRNG